MSRTRQARQAGRGNVRIVEAHDVADPHDQDEIEAADDRGRAWYRLRPKPRRRTDLWGFNSTWWMALGWVIVTLVAVSPFPWW
jgi:hypothetical protein